LRLANNIAPGKKIQFHIKASDASAAEFLQSQMVSLVSLLNASEVTISLEDYKAEDGSGAPSILGDIGAIFLPLKGLVDVAAEKSKLEKQQSSMRIEAAVYRYT
jgi:valyl-tRNA synthetase